MHAAGRGTRIAFMESCKEQHCEPTLRRAGQRRPQEG